jgi:hypothetical protein
MDDATLQVGSVVRPAWRGYPQSRTELINRADERTLPGVVSSVLQCQQGIFSHEVEQLAKYPSSLVASEVKTRLRTSTLTPEQLVRLLSILGAFGNPPDAQDISSYSRVQNESIRNVADETTKLLLDPLRLAESFREAWYAG